MMSHVHQVDCVNHSLEDLLKSYNPFARITIAFGGDPGQILLVVCHRVKANTVKAFGKFSKF